MNTKYDVELEEMFNGILTYKKTDYLTGNSYLIEINYHNGKINSVELKGFTEYKGESLPFCKTLNKKRWNDAFWKKAPKYVNCDECNYKRVSIIELRKPSNTIPAEDSIGLYV